MDIGIVKEVRSLEQRVPLSPGAASGLVAAGHTVYVQSGAGEACRFTDEDYRDRGATVVFSAEEAYGRAQLVMRVSPPSIEELQLMTPGGMLLSFLHLAMVSPRYLDVLLERKITAIGCEIIRDNDSGLPVLASVSEIAGSLAVQLGSQLLQSDQGGRGILIDGAPGVAPANVLVIGAGSAGTAAARRALNTGARVLLLDKDIRKLRQAEYLLGSSLVTGVASAHSLADWVRSVDLLIGAVLVPGGRAPVVVTEQMVQSMPKRSVIIDLSIDQGGCVATSRPTTLASPTFEAHGVIHCCVTNITSSVARTSSFALSHALFPYVQALGAAKSFAEGPGDLLRGTYTHDGAIVNETLAQLTGRPAKPLAK